LIVYRNILHAGSSFSVSFVGSGGGAKAVVKAGRKGKDAASREKEKVKRPIIALSSNMESKPPGRYEI
jgi:hypothetical protein